MKTEPRTSASGLVTNLGLLNFDLLCRLPELIFDLIKGTVPPVLLTQIKALELSIGKILYLGVNFLLEELFRGEALLLRFRFKHLLFDQAIKRPFLNVVLLPPQRH